MFNKDAIIITDWQKGIADSPSVGFSTMVNVDVNKVGSLTVAPTPQTIRQVTVPQGPNLDRPVQAVYDSGYSSPLDQQLFVLYKNGQVYRKLSPLDPSVAPTLFATLDVTFEYHDMVFWKGYLIVAGDNGYNVIDSTTGTVNAGAFPLGNTLTKIFIASDDRVYGGSDVSNLIQALSEVTGQTFDPTNAATYTVNTSVLDIPQNFVTTNIGQLGQDLMIGTLNRLDSSVSTIFPWDRQSPSFRRPINIAGASIAQLITKSNYAYCTTSGSMELFEFNSSSVVSRQNILDKIREDYTTSGSNGSSFYENLNIFSYIDGYRNAMEVVGDDLLFAVTPLSVGLFSNEIVYPFGIYKYNTKTGAVTLRTTLPELSFDNTPYKSTSNKMSVTFIRSMGPNTICFGWFAWNGTTDYTHGVSIVYGDSYIETEIDPGNSFVETKVYNIGTPIQPRTLQYIEMEFDKPLRSNDVIRVYHRPNVGSTTWTLGGTWSCDTVGTQIGTVSSHHDSYSYTGTTVQFKIVIASKPTTSIRSAESIGLRYIRFS